MNLFWRTGTFALIGWVTDPRSLTKLASIRDSNALLTLTIFIQIKLLACWANFYTFTTLTAILRIYIFVGLPSAFYTVKVLIVATKIAPIFAILT